MIALGKHVAEKHKTFCLNLSAPFICQFFKALLFTAAHSFTTAAPLLRRTRCCR